MHFFLGPELGLFVGTDHVGVADRRFLVGGSTIGIVAEGGNAAGIDDAFNTGFGGSHQHVAGAVNIDPEHGRRIAGPQPIVGGHMKEAAAIFGGPFQRSDIGQVAFGNIDSETPQIGVVAAGADQHPNVVTVVEQAANHRRTNKPGCSCYQ